MKVYFVGAGPGDIDLLTIKGKKLLENCKCCIYAGSLISPEVLALIPETAEKHDSSSMTLEETTAVVSGQMKKGTDVVRLHSGEPSIFGAIREQMDELDMIGVEYEVVPGISSFQAAAAALCLELTVPEKSQTVILTRAAGRTPVPEGQDLEKLARTGATLCIFLSVQMIEDVVKKLVPEYGQNCPVAVVFRASWPDQLIIKGTLGDIGKKTSSADIKKTAMIIVGEALSRGHAASKLYNASFSHEYRKAK